jgi:hypothetical protein
MGDWDREYHVTESDIRTAAYFLWEGRGRVHGFDKADWYAAQVLLRRNNASIGPRFHPVNAAVASGNLKISHRGHDELFNPSCTWIEITAHPKTIFDFDRNRRLHFDEGFLNACYRILKDPSITRIAQSHHFPFRDLANYRHATYQIINAYRQSVEPPPPIFFCPAPYQLEILDGVHRCLAAFELALSPRATGNFCGADYRIWVGFNHHQLCAGAIANQIWVSSLCYSDNHAG